jgi:hypothetical protein
MFRAIDPRDEVDGEAIAVEFLAIERGCGHHHGIGGSPARLLGSAGFKVVVAWIFMRPRHVA